jgi:hypothetical protein
MFAAAAVAGAAATVADATVIVVVCVVAEFVAAGAVAGAAVVGGPEIHAVLLGSLAVASTKVTGVEIAYIFQVEVGIALAQQDEVVELMATVGGAGAVEVGEGSDTGTCAGAVAGAAVDRVERVGVEVIAFAGVVEGAFGVALVVEGEGAGAQELYVGVGDVAGDAAAAGAVGANVGVGVDVAACVGVGKMVGPVHGGERAPGA